jgi:MFS transporter, ACS family, glucarate transporter
MNRDLSPLPLTQNPTRVRFGVLGFVCALSMITYLDRVCFGAAVSNLVTDLHLSSEADLKWALTAFAISYALFEIPSGWLGDVYGPRIVLIRIVLWWSVFTALTGLAGLSVAGLVIGTGALVAIRFLFGMGEAGAYPNITRALHNWFPFGERGLAQGSVWMAGRLMGGLTPLVWMLIIVDLRLSWRAAFGLFGLLGLGWCVAFALWFRNRPEEKAGVNEAELAQIRLGKTHPEETSHGRVPWMKLLTSTNLWCLCLMYFCGAYGWYFNITYLPRFLEEQHGVEVEDRPQAATPDAAKAAGTPERTRTTRWVGAFYKGGPLWMGAVACLVGGFLTDRFIRRTGNRRWGRRLFGIAGHGLCALCYLACLITPTAFTFFLAISFAAFFNDLTMGPSWAICQDIGKKYAAIVAGCMNTIGNLGGAVATWVTGTILQASLDAHAAALGSSVDGLSRAEKAAGLMPGYQINFVLFAGVYFVAVLLWLRIDSTEPVSADA